MMNSQPSPMQAYMANYGQRLQSLLAGDGMPPQDTSQSQLGPGSAVPQGLGTAPAAAPAGPAPAGPAQSGMAPASPVQPGAPAPSAEGSSFKAKWDQSSQKERDDFTEDLDAQLRKGNKTIDTAYDDLVRQMGTRPDEKLSKQEKGMMLMEFGLSLMANSNAKAYGTDTAGAIGAAGSQVLAGHRARTLQQQSQYDTRRFDIEKERAGSKSELAKQTVLEARSEARDDRRAARENSQLAGVVTQPDDTVIGYTKGGQASQLELEGGKKVKAKPKPASLGGTGGRGFEVDRRYQMYMDTYGKDGSGQPLQGEQLEAVKKRALAFAADPKQATMSDSEMRSMAERTADNFQRSNWAQFRDMNPEQIKAWRDKNAEETYQRLKRGEEASLSLPAQKGVSPAGHGAPARRSQSQLGAVRKPTAQAGPRQFKSEADVAAAFNAGDIKKGDTVQVGGKSFRVQ